HGANDHSMPLIKRRQGSLVAQIQLVCRLKIRYEIDGIVNCLAKGIGCLNLIMIAVPFGHADGHAVIDRTAGRFDTTVLQDSRIDGPEHGTEGIRPCLSEIDISRSDQFHTAIPDVVSAYVQTQHSPIDAEAELLAVRIDEVGIRAKQNRRRHSWLQAER